MVRGSAARASRDSTPLARQEYYPLSGWETPLAYSKKHSCRNKALRANDGYDKTSITVTGVSTIKGEAKSVTAAEGMRCTAQYVLVLTTRQMPTRPSDKVPLLATVNLSNDGRRTSTVPQRTMALGPLGSLPTTGAGRRVFDFFIFFIALPPAGRNPVGAVPKEQRTEGVVV